MLPLKGELPKIVNVLLQAHAQPVYLRGVGNPHIAEVPGLVPDAGQILLPGLVADDIAVLMAVAIDPGILPGAVVVAAGAVAVENGQVHHQAGVVLAAAGLGYVLFRVVQAAALGALVKEVLLEFLCTITGHHIDGLAAPLVHECIQHPVEGVHRHRGQEHLPVTDIVAAALLIIDAVQLLVLREVVENLVVYQDQLPGVERIVLHIPPGAGNPRRSDHICRQGLLAGRRFRFHTLPPVHLDSRRRLPPAGKPAKAKHAYYDRCQQQHHVRGAEARTAPAAVTGIPSHLVCCSSLSVILPPPAAWSETIASGHLPCISLASFL